MDQELKMAYSRIEILLFLEDITAFLRSKTPLADLTPLIKKKPKRLNKVKL